MILVVIAALLGVVIGLALPKISPSIGEITGGARVHYIGGDSLSNCAVAGMLLGQQLAGAAN